MSELTHYKEMVGGYPAAVLRARVDSLEHDVRHCDAREKDLLADIEQVRKQRAEAASALCQTKRALALLEQADPAAP